MASSNSVNSGFVKARPTREIGNIPIPGKKPSQLDSQSEPLRPFASIVLQNFVKAHPRARLPIHAQNLNRSSGTQEEASEESSEITQRSSNSQSEKSAEENQESVGVDIAALSTSDQAPRVLNRWTPDAATRQKERRLAGERKKPLPERQVARRNLPPSGGVRNNLKSGDLSLSSEFEAVLNMSSEPDHPLESTRKEKQQTLSVDLKNTIIDIIPKFSARKTKNRLPASEAKLRKLQKDMLKQLQNSKLHSEAGQAQMLPETMGITMSPGILESYLKSLLNDERARETIKNCKLTASEAVAIRYYGLEGFQFVQPSLREKADPSLGSAFAPAGTFGNLIEECNGAFAKLPPLPLGTELFRGTNFLFRDDLQVDETYLDPAFVSASTSREVATQKFTGKYLLIFEVPEKDPRFRDVSTLTGNAKEAEGLGLPGIRFRVVSRGEGAGTAEDPEIVRLSPIAII